LPHKLLQRAGTHPLGEGTPYLAFLGAVSEEVQTWVLWASYTHLPSPPDCVHAPANW